MSFEQFKVLVKGLKSAYTRENFLPDEYSVKVWYKALMDIPYEVANAAAQEHIMTSKYAPSIAEIRTLAVQIVNGKAQTWGESWEKACKAIQKYGAWNEKKALESLDPLTRRAVESIGFQDLCSSENAMADRAHYQRVYEQLMDREEHDNNLALPLREEKARLSGITSISEVLLGDG